jgi:hypothetical protein
MILSLGAGILYILLKSIVFHESHVSPGVAARLFSLRLPSFIQNSFELYSQGVIWVSYLYLLLLISGIMIVFELIYSWVFFVSLVFAVVTTALLVLDIEKEMHITKDGEKMSTEDSELNYGDEYA